MNQPTEKVSRRWKCVCAYDGTRFSGWQSQAGGNSVQDAIESALGAILKKPVRIHGSGRTDAGVHARAQVFHFDAAWPHGAEKLIAALRAKLPDAIQVKSARMARADFHARFHAIAKRYTYDIRLGDADPFARPYCWTLYRPLDVGRMKSAAAGLVGRHDFRAFTAVNGPERENTVRTLRRLEVARRGRRVRIVAEADGFMFKMVRSLVGVLVAVGEGRLAVEDVARILHSGRRTEEVQTAPPHGLFLDRVFYGKAKTSP